MILFGKKYTLTKKGWIVLSILCIGLLSILLYFGLNSKNKVVFETYTIESTTSEKLSNALRNKEISIDEYVLYSAYSIYDSNKLDKKYKSNVEYEMAPDLYNLMQNYSDELSEETKKYINDKIQMKNVILGPETNETSYNNSNLTPISNNVAITGDLKTRLDKYILSPNKKVVVWYTTKNTEDKITDEQAKQIADNIEIYIEKYSDEYDIEFKWEKSYCNGYNETKYMEFLKNIDSNSADALFNAMPVYVSSSVNNTKSVAYYIGAIPNVQLSDQSETNNSNLGGIPVAPYISVASNKISDSNSLNSTIAHELFHHYQPYICGEGTYQFCENNEKGDPLFIKETTANWAATKITDNSILMNGYITSYLYNYYKSIDEINPYAAMYFLHNYENIVDNGKQKILNGLLKKNHNGDTLKYLYEAANGKMPEVLNSLAKNNLINDYKFEAVKGLKEANYSYIGECNMVKNGDGEEVCDLKKKIIKNTDGTIKNVSMEYFFSEKTNKKYKISNLSNNNTEYINIFSLSNLKEFEGYNQKVESFADQKVVYSQKFTGDVIVDLSKIDGEQVVISITNGHLTDEMKYKIEETSDNMNIELNTTTTNNTNNNNNNSSNSNDRPSQIYNIYIDNKEYKINNFAQNNRAFVNIKELCNTGICIVSYINNNYNKISVMSIFKTNNNVYQYILNNEKGTQNFNSGLIAKDQTFYLSQLNVDAPSCPEGKDSNGYDIPKCDESSFYVPIRFVSQALGYDVTWNKDNPNRIDINTGLQDKIIKENNYRSVISKDKISIGNVVTNFIELNNTQTLSKNTTYYAYLIDKDNKRVFNSGFVLLSGSSENFKIINDLETNNNNNVTYSTLKTGNSGNGTIAIISTITIEDKEYKSKSGIYPIISEVNVNIQ